MTDDLFDQWISADTTQTFDEWVAQRSGAFVEGNNVCFVGGIMLDVDVPSGVIIYNNRLTWELGKLTL